MFRLVAMVVLPAVLLSCGPSEEKRAADDYVAAMTPLLVDNTRLSRKFLELGAQIKKHRATPQEVATQLDRRGERVEPRHKIWISRPLPACPGGANDPVEDNMVLANFWQRRWTLRTEVGSAST